MARILEVTRTRGHQSLVAGGQMGIAVDAGADFRGRGNPEKTVVAALGRGKNTADAVRDPVLRYCLQQKGDRGLFRDYHMVRVLPQRGHGTEFIITRRA